MAAEYPGPALPPLLNRQAVKMVESGEALGDFCFRSEYGGTATMRVHPGEIPSSVDVELHPLT